MDATDHQSLCGAWVERKPTANLMPVTCQQAVMDNASERTSEPSLRRTGLRRLYGLVQKRTRIGAGGFPSDQYSFPLNPADSTVLKLRKTNTRNGVTTQLVLLEKEQVPREEQVVNRKPLSEGIVQEALAGRRGHGNTDGEGRSRS